MTPYWRVHGAAFPHDSMHHRFVHATHVPSLQLIDQPGMCCEAARHHHDPRGVLVQPMHDPGPGDGRQFRVVVQQRILQRAVGIAGRGMHHQARRFVQHQQMSVGEQDIQGEVLGLYVNRSFRDGFQAQVFPA